MTPDGDVARAPRSRLLTWGLPALALVGALVAVAVVLASRGGGDDDAAAAAPARSRSSTIAWSPTGRALWVTSPDDDRVVAIDPASLDVIDQVEVPGQPRELTVLDADLVVTASQSTDLAVIQPGAGPAAFVAMPCGGTRSVVTIPGSRLAVVTCPSDDRLVLVDLDRILAVATIDLPGRPTGIVRDGEVLTVSTAGDGRLHAFDVDDLVDALDQATVRPQVGDDDLPELGVEPRSSRRAWTDGNRTASSLGALDAGPRGPVGVYQVVDNQRRLTAAEIEAGSTYGSPKDGRARLEPAIAGACGARFSSLEDEHRRLSGPVAVAATADDGLVWVVGEFSHSVSVVRCTGAGSGERSATVAAFDVGEGARGIVLDDDGRTAYVDVGFDHEVTKLVLPDGAPAAAADDPIERTEPAAVGRRKVDDRYLSPLAQEGRRMFNDGTNTHLTPFGVVTCGSCHPSAGEDGLSWRIERVDPDTRGIERKVRRTPPAWQVDPDVKPLHWNGEFTDIDDLSLTTIQQLLGGDGLLVDTAALSAYVAEVAAPPTTPTGDAATTARSQQDGQALLADLGCTSCHAGDAGTDGRAHDVLSPSTVADGDLPEVITPALRSVRGRAPYGHDGRAPDLEALLGLHEDGAGDPLALSPDELAAVVAYLRTR